MVKGFVWDLRKFAATAHNIFDTEKNKATKKKQKKQRKNTKLTKKKTTNKQTNKQKTNE